MKSFCYQSYQKRQKKQYQIVLSLREKKNNKSDIQQAYFQKTLSILPINHQCDLPL